jgi:hypothetical protein
MPPRQKSLKVVLAKIVPAGAISMSFLISATALSNASLHFSKSQDKASANRLATLRSAVFDINQEEQVLRLQLARNWKINDSPTQPNNPPKAPNPPRKPKPSKYGDVPSIKNPSGR